MHSKNIPIKSILICDKCGSTDIIYSNDVDGVINENYVSITEWAIGIQQPEKNFDYTETVECNRCHYKQVRRRKKR